MGCYIASNKNIIKYIINLNLFLIIIVHIIFTQFNMFSFVNQILLFVMIIKIGFMNFNYINKFFNKNDLSYGIYLYHMPIINFILYKNLDVNFYIVVVILLITSFCSWNLVEKNFLKKKYII